jgi:hypothetical protein
VIGGSMTADPNKPQAKPQAVGMAGAPAVVPAQGYSCNRKNPGKGYAKGHCKH